VSISHESFFAVDARKSNLEAATLAYVDSMDELWSVVQTPEYRERSNEFRRSVNAITAAARKSNLEAATLAYVDSMMKRVTCHKYVRQTRSDR